MKALEHMVGRRTFLRQALFAVLALTGYGTGCMAGGVPATVSSPAPGDGIVIRVPETISWARTGQRNVTVTGRLPARLVAAGMPAGLVLCAVEANRQTPYSTNLAKGKALAGKKPVREGGSVRFEVSADIVAALGLPEIETTYYVHAACGPYRSGVAALKMVKGT